jgi:hypothetical protein
VLFGQEGNDWVGVSGNNNSLNGAQGDDYIAATGNGNVLDGGAGNDQLVAGAHAGDRFVFHAGYGVDVITGFARHGAGGTDLIDLAGFGLNFTTLQPFLATVGGNGVVAINAATCSSSSAWPARNCRRATSCSEGRAGHTKRRGLSPDRPQRPTGSRARTRRRLPWGATRRRIGGEPDRELAQFFTPGRN